MKKFAIALLIIQSTVMVGCNRQNAMVNQAQVGTPGSAYGGGAGYADPSLGGGTGYADPTYGGGAGYADPTYGGGAGYADPTYGGGAGYGAGTGYTDPNNPYGTGAGYGQPQIDPNTGMPIAGGGINPQMDPGVTQQIINVINAAGGYKALKADNKAIEFMKGMGMSMQQAFMHSPLQHRALIIKTLLDGWAGSDEKNYSQQIWATIQPQDQQMLLSQDPELAKLVNKKLLGNSSSGGGGASGVVSSIVGSIGKLVGLKK